MVAGWTKGFQAAGTLIYSPAVLTQRTGSKHPAIPRCRDGKKRPSGHLLGMLSSSMRPRQVLCFHGPELLTVAAERKRLKTNSQLSCGTSRWEVPRRPEAHNLVQR